MATTRGQVMLALGNLVSGLTFSTAISGFSTWKTPPVASGMVQRLRLWGDVPPDQQPAAFVVTHRELDEYRGLGLERRRLELGLWCYSRNQGAIGSQSDLDTMMQALEPALAPDDPSRGTFTLGGLVYWCRIEGRVFKDPGDLDYQALLIVPIVVEMP